MHKDFLDKLVEHGNGQLVEVLVLKLTVLNARTDTILLELTGTFALENNSSNELEVIIETAEGKYQKDYVYLNDYTMYVVEDISGSDVDKYHYEINFLPQWELKITENE